jgi:hypothetical protein
MYIFYTSPSPHPMEYILYLRSDSPIRVKFRYLSALPAQLHKVLDERRADKREARKRIQA